MSTSSDAPTRPAIWETPVTYGAIGVTRADDLLQYPPRGFRAIERRVRIGHGADRWEHACTETMSWGIQRRAGIRVRVQDGPAELRQGTYTPVSFQDGAPYTPSRLSSGGEQVFAADGAELLHPGDTAIMRVPLWPFDVPARVVYVVEEPRRRGFAYGTLPGHPERGEEAFVVELGDDDTVWLTIRAISRPANPLFWLGYPFVRIMQAVYTRRYERVLTQPLATDPAD